MHDTNSKDGRRKFIITTLSEQLGVPENEIKDESHIEDDLGADSLDSVEIAMTLEDELQFEIPDAEVDEWLRGSKPGAGTVGSLIAFIEQKCVENGRG